MLIIFNNEELDRLRFVLIVFSLFIGCLFLVFILNRGPKPKYDSNKNSDADVDSETTDEVNHDNRANHATKGINKTYEVPNSIIVRQTHPIGELNLYPNRIRPTFKVGDPTLPFSTFTPLDPYDTPYPISSPGFGPPEKVL